MEEGGETAFLKEGRKRKGGRKYTKNKGDIHPRPPPPPPHPPTRSQTNISEMHAQVDGRSASDAMVEGLTNRNLTLEDTVETLTLAQRELEERVEVGEEMEEVMGEEIKVLKKEIEGWETKASNLEEAVRRQRGRELEGEKVVGKYKELVRKLREDLGRMEDERRGEEGGEVRRIDRERKAREEVNRWRKREIEREGIVKEVRETKQSKGRERKEKTTKRPPTP